MKWLLKKQIDKGKKADQLSAELQEVISDMKSEAFKQFKDSKMNQTEERENVYKIMVAIQLFEGLLKKRVNDGKMAERKQKELDKQALKLAR